MMSPLGIAVSYLHRGWAVVPVPLKSKGPTVKGWQNLRITEADARQWFNGEAQNIGVLMGEASGGLTDVDLDWPEARASANYFLPPTCIFGRASSSGAHRLYVTELTRTETKAATKFPFEAEGCKPDVLELRIGGGGSAAQTIFPGSVHTSGEAIEWEDRRPPVRMDGAELKKGLAQTAAASVLAHLYPLQGGRHDAAVVIGGFLARGGYTAPEAKLFVEAIAVASCQPPDKRRDMIRAADSGVADFAAGKPVAGFPKLGEVFGEKAANVADWLGYEGELEPEEVPAAVARKRRKNQSAAPSEDTLALDFAGRHGDELRFVSFWGKWLKWTAERWQVEKTLAAFDLARKICHGHSLGGLRAKTVAAIEQLARSDRRLAATPDQWDADPWLFNKPAGTVELKTGCLRASAARLHHENCRLQPWRRRLPDIP